MTYWELFGIAVWVIGMVYSAVAVGLPSIRMYWLHTLIKFGPVSSLGLAWFFWGVPLLLLVMPDWGKATDTLVWMLFCGVGAILFTVGYLMDVFDSRK